MAAELSSALRYPLLATPPSPRVEVDASLADALAMRRLAEGDIAALGELYDRHHAAVWRFACRMTGSEVDADDVVHQTFLALLKTAASFDSSRSFRPWLLGTAMHLMRRQRTSVARWARLLARFRSAPDFSPDDPERTVSAREHLSRVNRALTEMNEGKRAVLLLSELEGLKGEQIAEALGIPLGTVWTRLHHARRELAAALSPEEGA